MAGVFRIVLAAADGQRSEARPVGRQVVGAAIEQALAAGLDCFLLAIGFPFFVERSVQSFRAAHIPAAW
jgi:hypothetical protein